MSQNLVREAKTLIEVPNEYLKVPQFSLEVPIYVVTSRLLGKAFEYLIINNPLGKYDPDFDKDVRLERIIGFGGPKDKNIRIIDTILFPLMIEQNTTLVKANQLDYVKLEEILEAEGRVHHGRMHNHNEFYGWKLNPTPPDIDTHKNAEEFYKVPQLTVIVSEYGSFGFWRPTAYEVFVDGQKLPLLVGPDLQSNIRHYNLQ